MKLGFARRPSIRIFLVAIVLIVAIGAAVGIMNFGSTMTSSTTQDFANGAVNGPAGSGALPYGVTDSSNSGNSAPTNQPVTQSNAGGTVTTLTESSVAATSSSSSFLPYTNSGNSSGSGGNIQPQANSPQIQKSNQSGFIEFFSNMTIQVISTQSALSRATAVAYSLGGYLAFSSYSNISSIAVLRVPAANYVTALSQIEGLGNLTGFSSNSNDVSIQYTDLNATLQSLLTEQASLLKLVNSSTSLNTTLLLESQIQSVDSHINEIQSEILQTRLLITYSTITTTFNARISGPTPAPLKMKLTATPTSGLNPLSVTFNAIVAGGSQPYIINYDFGDGSNYQGQSVIHTFTSSGTFNVTVTATDASGNAILNFTTIHVKSPPVAAGFSSFGSYALGLLVSVVEGIIEVAVVLLPIALVVTAIVLPFRNRLRATSKSEVKS